MFLSGKHDGMTENALFAILAYLASTPTNNLLI
jgi:hypothetical protein